MARSVGSFQRLLCTFFVFGFFFARFGQCGLDIAAAAESFDLPAEAIADAPAVDELTSVPREADGYGEDSVEGFQSQEGDEDSLMGVERETPDEESEARQLGKKKSSSSSSSSYTTAYYTYPQTVQYYSTSPVWTDSQVWTPVEKSQAVYPRYIARRQGYYTPTQSKGYYYPVEYVNVQP